MAWSRAFAKSGGMNLLLNLSMKSCNCTKKGITSSSYIKRENIYIYRQMFISKDPVVIIKLLVSQPLSFLPLQWRTHTFNDRPPAYPPTATNKKEKKNLFPPKKGGMEAIIISSYPIWSMIRRNFCNGNERISDYDSL